MPDILVRGLDARVVKQLKAKAKQHGRSLQGEAKRLLEQGAGIETSDFAQILDKWKKRFAGRTFGASLDDLREDRER